MDAYIRQLKNYIKMTRKSIPGNNFHTILELVWYFHSMYYPINSEGITKKMEELEDITKQLSRKKKHHLVAEVVELCLEHERAAFVSGLQVGAQLMMETFEKE